MAADEKTARRARETAVQQLVDAIRYFKDGTWYDMNKWVEEDETASERFIPVDNSINDHIVVQSDPERKFAAPVHKTAELVQSRDARWSIQPRLGVGNGASFTRSRPAIATNS